MHHDRHHRRHHRHRDHHDDRGDHHNRGPERGQGPDTRFLQLEMSQVLYGEAESVAKDAFRELLAEAAKECLRERFGNEIRGLAELAIDELLADVYASLEIESEIEERNDGRRRTRDRLRDIFGQSDDGDESGGD